MRCTNRRFTLLMLLYCSIYQNRASIPSLSEAVVSLYRTRYTRCKHS